jgi:excisionase family DNA binding protein
MANEHLEKQVMNLKELSAYTGYSKSTLYKKVMNKEFDFYRVNRTLFFKLEDVKNWLFKNKVDSIDNSKNDSI